MTSMTDQKPTLLLRESYLAFIKNSVGSRAYRSLYARVDGTKQDLLDNGNRACAYFVSSVLVLFEFIQKRHATVVSTVKDLEESGWQLVDVNQPKPGDVIVWAAKDFDDGPHQHIGFVLTKSFAVSTSSTKRRVIRHPLTSADGRPIEAIYRYPYPN
ncbi:hypothetical protein HY523_02880 [Candidatus Berkelbacteria bacterium]|nr:hypothetical protein [Candidatus Berkelbacteria bacterium]